MTFMDFRRDDERQLLHIGGTATFGPFRYCSDCRQPPVLIILGSEVATVACKFCGKMTRDPDAWNRMQDAQGSA